MSCGLLPPVPDLIPISQFNKAHSLNNNRQRECAPCETHREEVMGEQRSRRTGKQPAIDLIDTSRSRGLSAASQAPFRKTRPERHRKSDRKREYRNCRKRSSSKQRTRTRESSPQWSVNPRVNPIFVWARQENNHIVEVKCEDYDKRNRILLTKTAQGWRAIPRTETLVPTLKEEDDKGRCRMRKQRKTHRIKRKSTGVQVDEDITQPETQERSVSPMWTDPVNVESHLPSHTIHIPQKRSPTPQEFAQSDEIINSATSSSTQKPVIGCNINKSSDVSPLDNLLAVAELEFNHQLQSGEWNKCNETDTNTEDHDNIEKQKPNDYIDNIEQLNNFINSCTNSDSINDAEHIIESFNDVQSKTDDCDYNEDDDNNLAMDDILNRLEQSLRSPEALNSEILNECDNLNSESADLKDDDDDDVVYDEPKETKFEVADDYAKKSEIPYDPKITETIVESSSDDIDSSSDLRNKIRFDVEDIQPTDLSLPKRKENKSPPPPPRPPSQNSETIQSPQPSGIPAVPQSPDIFSNSTDNKTKSLFLETLLSNSCQKNTHNNIHVTQQKEPLDLGNFRKSASPTVTCSEEVKNKSCFSEEPSMKKLKVDDITLKKLLDMNPMKGNINFDSSATPNHQTRKEASRLLELLSIPVESDPVAQLSQLLSDNSINIPDPMLVPKDRLSQILSSPAREIPRLLIDRPELRLPQALAYPYLLQDPDILVITLSQLETIIQKQSQFVPVKDAKQNENKRAEMSEEKRYSKPENPKRLDLKQEIKNEKHNMMKEPMRRSGYPNELVKDIDAASNAAFNQMMWLPYLNQLDFSNFNNNSDLLKLLTFLPPYSTHAPDMSLFMGVNRYMQQPPAFPMQQPFNDSLEFSTWQEAMMQANMLRPNNQYDMCNSKNFYNRYCGEKHSYQKSNHFGPKPNHKANKMHNVCSNVHQNNHNPMMNLPSNYYAANKTNLQVPQYNPVLTHANMNEVMMKSKSAQQHSMKNGGSRTDMYNQRHEDKKLSHTAQAPRLDHQGINNNYKMNNKSHPTFSHQEIVNKACSDSTKHHSAMQPIDLSGSSTLGSRLKVRQHLIDPNHAQKLLKHDDVPEVGSTTASIEEMQDAQKFLWHPLFGNQKNYGNPWNWTTVTATGE